VLFGFLLTLLLGTLFFLWGMRLGRALLRKGATANDLFKGKTPASLAFLGLYVFLLAIALSIPQIEVLPVEFRFHGLRVSWMLLRVFLLGACGMAFTVSWYTARPQVFSIILVSVIGLAGFSGTEAYLLTPIYPSLQDNLLPNGVYKQTSDSSCAPAALATVLNVWGIPATESEIARFAGTSRLGTTMPQLIVATKELGMEALELRPTWEEMQQINRPGVLAVWLFDGDLRLPHAVALIGLDDHTATIADPSRGQIFRLDRSMFSTIWRDQYVPIFRTSDRYLTHIEAAQYLSTLGYLNDPRALSQLPQAIQHFQTEHHLPASGKLDTKTILYLSGPFLEGVPRLDQGLLGKSAQANYGGSRLVNETCEIGCGS
jgi:predicted double-glycine peptidase